MLIEPNDTEYQYNTTSIKTIFIFNHLTKVTSEKQYFLLIEKKQHKSLLTHRRKGIDRFFLH